MREFDSATKLTAPCHDTPPTVSIPLGQWNVTCVGSIRRKTHEALPRYTANSEHTIGAMDNSSRKVQNVSAHSRLRTHKAADSEFSGAMEDMLTLCARHLNLPFEVSSSVRFFCVLAS